MFSNFLLFNSFSTNEKHTLSFTVLIQATEPVAMETIKSNEQET